MVPLEDQIAVLSQQLKNEVSAFDLESFAGFFTYFIKYRKTGTRDMDTFISKLKDFTYLMALNATATKRGEKEFWDEGESLMRWSKILEEIKALYKKVSLGDLGDTEEDRQNIIHHISFHTYFENGALNYVEQDLDRLKRIFTPYDHILERDFGFNTEFLIDIYRFSEFVGEIKYNRQNEFKETPEFQRFLSDVDHSSFEERLNALPDEIRDKLDEFMDCSHASFKFTKEEYCSAFPEEKISRFLELFSFEPHADDRYLFFAQANPLDDKPILKLPSDEYLYTYQRQLPVAAANFLYKHLQKDKKLGDKIRKHRDKMLEKKTEDIFRMLFKNDKQAFFYNGYHVEKNTEQDLLILYKGLALIIEIKASKYREPFRNPTAGYLRLKDDFDDSIQYGYKQCLRIEDKFFGKEPFDLIINDKVVYRVNPDKYPNVFSIVVTLERFGLIQTDLNLLLEKDPNFHFPWSVYIDDLETFILALKKLYNNPLAQFKDYLKLREKLHGRAYATDEMDICGAFLSNKPEFIRIANEVNASATFSPENEGVFDRIYYTGLGFEDEMFIDKKSKRKLDLGQKIQSWVVPLPDLKDFQNL